MTAARRIDSAAAYILLYVLVISAVLACGTHPERPGQDPIRQSDAEYDIARDFWMNQNQPRAALSHTLKAIELNEDNAEAEHLAALLYLDFCRRNARECRFLPDAEKHARNTLSLQPTNREARNTLGVILIHLERYQDAIATLKPLSEDIEYQTPENAWGNLGWAYYQLGQLDLAVDALRRSVAAQPAFCVGHFRLGLALAKKGETSLALESLGNAVHQDSPRCQALQEAYAVRARLLVANQQPTEAQADAERCVGLSKETPTGKECAALLNSLR